MEERIEVKEFHWKGGEYIDLTDPNRKREFKYKQSPKYLKGPIPLGWISRAANLPGKTLAVALMFWFLAGVTRSQQFKPERWLRDLFGVRRKAFYNALEALANEGLITVDRRVGKVPLIKIVSAKIISRDLHVSH